VPDFKVAEFAVVWKSWWESLQPTWRLRESWPLSRETPPGEDWSVLRRGGINGFFIVLMCFSWWASKKMSAREREEFEAAMVDVTWVIKKVSDSIALSTPLKRCAEGPLDGNAAKRQHI
jgi:hypothetical protein